ncbi:MAG: glycosyltransferase family 2 protein [Bacteroidetes bacterium]|nr:glycosyltransferase family 2 protein [Bacteroidota bacterium]
MAVKEFPLVSILLPVYNAEPYIHNSIQSILDQTYSNWELIIVDDGSTDHSVEVAEAFKDKRIQILKKSNSGMADSLNKAMAIAKGDYIARQDADDISLPERLEKQIRFMLKNTEIGLLGTWSGIINEKGESTRQFHKHPLSSPELKCDLFFDNPFVHSSAIFKRNVIDGCGVYDTTINSLVQDFEYWFRISRKYDVANIGEVLHQYRQLKSGISFSTSDFNAVVAKQSAENMKKVLGTEWHKDIDILSFAYHGAAMTNEQGKETVKRFKSLVEELVERTIPGEDKKVKTRIVNKHLAAFCKQRYNKLIKDNNDSFFKKTYFKISRELWLMTKGTSK